MFWIGCLEMVTNKRNFSSHSQSWLRDRLKKKSWGILILIIIDNVVLLEAVAEAVASTLFQHMCVTFISTKNGL